MAEYGDRTGRDTLDSVLARLDGVAAAAKRARRRRPTTERGDRLAVPAPVEGQEIVQYDTEQRWYFSNGEWRPYAGRSGGATFAQVVAATPDLTVWWRMGDTFTPAASVANALLDSAVYDASSPRNLDYSQDGATARVAVDQPNTALGTDDDGAVSWTGTPYGRLTPNGYTTGATAHDKPFRWGQTPGLRTIACWFNYTGPTAFDPTWNPNHPIVGNGTFPSGGGAGGWILHIDTYDPGTYPGARLNFSPMGTSTYIQGPVITAGAWYHVALTFDGTTYRLYVNGALVGSFAAGAALDGTGGAINIGWSQGHSGFVDFFTTWQGLIDEVALWSRPLTAAEVLSLYEAGAGAGGTLFEFPTIEIEY